jgi:hypothetical protein
LFNISHDGRTSVEKGERNGYKKQFDKCGGMQVLMDVLKSSSSQSYPYYESKAKQAKLWCKNILLSELSTSEKNRK